MENEQIKVARIIVTLDESASEVIGQIEQRTIYLHKLSFGINQMNSSVTDYFKLKQGLRIGERTAEAIGNAFPEDTNLAMDVRGRDIEDNVRRTISVTEEQISQAISAFIKAIIDSIKVAIEKIPKAALVALKNHGIILKGKGAHLRRLDKRLMIETNLPVVISNEMFRS